MTTRVTIDPEFEPSLAAAGLTRFDAIMGASGGASTSRHKHRETLPIEIRIDGSAKTFYLKRVFKVPRKHALLPLLSLKQPFTQPSREWENCRALEAAGIPVMKAAAWGERRWCGLPVQAFLLVAAAPMPDSLENWLVPGFPRPGDLNAELRDQLLFELGRLVGKLVAAGCRWPDISGKHIFAAQRANPYENRAWEFGLIDVETMAGMHQRCEGNRNDSAEELRRGIIKNLRILLKSLKPLQASEQDLERLWQGACGGITHSAGGPALTDIEDARHAAQLISIDRYPRRIRLPDDYEHPRTMPRARLSGMMVDARAIPWLEAAGLASFKDVFRYSSADNLDKPNLAAHRERIRVEATNGHGEKRTFFLKRYSRPPLGEQLRRMWEWRFRRGSSHREAYFSKRLGLLGIPTIHCSAAGESLKFIFERRSFLITDEIRGRSLEQMTREILAKAEALPPWEDRREIIRQLAQITSLLHEKRLFHRDLYLSHVFLTRNDDGAIVLRLIDLARMIEKPRMADRWIIKDLAALAYSSPAALVTRADRLRFLYDYLPGPATEKGREAYERRIGRIIRKVRSRVRRMARHDESRTRRYEKDARA